MTDLEVVSVKGPIEIEQLLTKSNVITEMADMIAASIMACEFGGRYVNSLSKCARLTLSTYGYKAVLKVCVRRDGGIVDLARAIWRAIDMGQALRCIVSSCCNTHESRKEGDDQSSFWRNKR
jgi:hypothetical protein